VREQADFLLDCFCSKVRRKFLIEYEDATRTIAGYEPQENTHNQRSVSFSFSLQILTREGLSLKGDATMQKTTTVPQRASKPVTVDVEQEYDDDNVSTTPRSALRFRSTTQPQLTRTTGPIAVAPVTTHHVSGSTRLLLWLVLVLCVAFLVNGIVLPAINDALNQIKYGDARIATYDINEHHFLTEEQDNKVKIVVSSADNQHNQVLVLPISGVASHALVTLTQNGFKIEVAVNGTYIAVLVPDGSNGYKWGNN